MQQTEPAVTLAGITLGSITALTVAALALLQVFDVYEITTAQNAAVVGFLGALWAVVIPMVYAIRGQVYSPAAVQDIKTELATAPPVDPQAAQTLAA